MRGALPALAGLLVAVAVGGGDDKPKAADDLRGTWKVLSAKETQGFEPNADVPEYLDSVWAFGDGRLTIKKGRAETRLAYALDPTKSPRQIDFGADLAGKDEGRPSSGIYKLDRERLTVCYTVHNARPTAFGMGPGVAAIKRLVVLQRVKD